MSPNAAAARSWNNIIKATYLKSREQLLSNVEANLRSLVSQQRESWM